MMNSRVRLIVVILAAVAVNVVIGVFVARPSEEQVPRASGAESQRHWVVKADRPIVIGGYGDNFDYSGRTVRPLRGYVTLDIDLEKNTGMIEATLHTTPSSGPLLLTRREVPRSDGTTSVQEELLEGEIKLVFHIDTQTRLVESAWLHGDTGVEAPVLPDVFNWLAGWPMADLYVNGELRYKNLGGHFMFAEQLRREDGTIRRWDGIYSMDTPDKSRFTIPGHWELHLMVMSMDEPDPNNFPPFARVLHVNFENIFVVRAPLGTLVNFAR